MRYGDGTTDEMCIHYLLFRKPYDGGAEAR